MFPKGSCVKGLVLIEFQEKDWILAALISSMAGSAGSQVKNLIGYWKGYGCLMGRTLLRGVDNWKCCFGDDIMSFLTLPCFLISTYKLHTFPPRLL